MYSSICMFVINIIQGKSEELPPILIIGFEEQYYGQFENSFLSKMLLRPTELESICIENVGEKFEAFLFLKCLWNCILYLMISFDLDALVFILWLKCFTHYNCCSVTKKKVNREGAFVSLFNLSGYYVNRKEKLLQIFQLWSFQGFYQVHSMTPII